MGENSMEKRQIQDKNHIQDDLLNLEVIKENLLRKKQQILDRRKHHNLQIGCIKRKDKKTENYFSVFFNEL